MAMFRWANMVDPFSTLRRMSREFDRVLGMGLGDLRRVGGGTYPAVNVLNSSGEMIVEAEVPGVSQDEIDLSITGETLVLKGSKQPPEDQDTRKYARRERGVGEFTRTIVLPDPVNADAVEAKLESGLLTIRLPKAESAKPRQIKLS